MKVFVHLARGFAPETWARRRAADEIVGVNDETPYGYHRAREMGCEVTFSQDHAEGAVGRLIRLAARAVLGFDLLHAWRNRRAMAAADVVWTHTESQSLGVAACLSRRTRRPKLLLQSVWLIDRWDQWEPRRPLWRRLMARADALAFLSPLNRARAATVWPNTRCAFVRFGIPTEARRAPADVRVQGPFRLIAVGNDRHRDWDSLIAAVAPMPDVALRIVSTRLDPRRAQGAANIEIAGAAGNEDLAAAYATADLVIAPLKPNLHASGITAIQEAAVFGVPVVATRVGGLEAYFTEDEVAYAPPSDPAALRATISALLADPSARRRLAEAAQARMQADDLSAEAYIAQLVALSREMLADDRI